MYKNLFVIAVSLLSEFTVRAYQNDEKQITDSLKCKLHNDEDNLPKSHSYERAIEVELAQPGQFPFQAFIGVCGSNWDSPIYCVGSLISAHFVLTHRDCFPGHMVIGAKVTLGVHDIAIEEENHRVSYLVLLRQIYVRGEPAHGLALIELPEKVAFTERISPIRLPGADLTQDNIEGKQAVVAGWGELPQFFNLSVVQFANFAIPKNEYCAYKYPAFEPMSDICIADDVTNQPSFADFGSPLILAEMPTRHDQMILIGVGAFFSRNPNFNVNVFTRVTRYLGWIHDTINAPRYN